MRYFFHTYIYLWQPKIYISVKEIPRTQTGKPARRLAAEIAENNTTG